MMLLNIEYIPGKRIEALGLVKGTTAYSKSFGKDFMAGMKTLVGGEKEGYTQLLSQARQIATKRIVDEAEEMGADAVVNVRYASASIMQGAAEITTLAVSVAGWFLLPDELVVQIGLDGQPSNVLPKPAGLLIPLGLGALGAFLACSGERRRSSGWILLAAAFGVAVITLLWNL